MISLEEAWELVAAAVPGPLAAERVPLGMALGRLTAEKAAAAVDLPPFDRSAMDGFAVRAAEAPGPWRLAGEVAAGGHAPELEPGSALAITTGAPIPAGADAVLRSEHAEVEAGAVRATQALRAGLHIRRRGEDVNRGDVLAPAGARLNIQRLSALASAGVGEVAVRRRPEVRILVTGDELLPLGAPPQAGKVHESNGITLALLIGREPETRRVADTLAATRDAVQWGLEADVLIVCGGVSVGPHDHVKPALAECGVEEIFWRVRVKPGKPLWFGRRADTLVFGLPGNPLSCVVGYLALVEPALRRLEGERDAVMARRRAKLLSPAAASDGRTTFLTARIQQARDGSLSARPTTRQGSHMTGALGESDGFVIVPHDAGDLTPGSSVDVVLL